jgi:DNA-binding CsgD family transcriptional regulator/PAS domain-containing protein
MAANRTIGPAIADCYDAAFDFKRWPEALQKLADALGTTSCVIRTSDETHPFAADQRHNRSGLAPDSTEHAEFTALWLDKIEGAPDPHLSRPQQLGKPALCFIVEDEITTPEERKSLPYYQEIARRGRREWYAAVEFPVKNRTWSLAMFRDARRGPFDICEADHFMRVAPDLSRIISMAEKLWDIAIDPSLALLDQLNCPAALLDCRGNVRRFNAAAEVLFGSGLTIRGGRIHTTDRASDTRLQGLIGSANSNRPSGSCWAEPVVIARNGSPWLIAEIVPMTSFVHELFNGGDALLYFTDLIARRVAPSTRLLSETFQLTAAEARLASNLAAGEGIGAAIAKLGIRRETVRTQLRAIFAKTGTSRQAELTALLSRLRTPSQQ